MLARESRPTCTRSPLVRSWLLALAALAFAGCAPSDEDSTPVEGVAEDEVTDVSHTAIRRQSIGNCWIYASVGWIESLRMRHANEQLNLSESYITWWHWYDQIVDGEASDHVETGGHWGVAMDIIHEHGIADEASFIPEEATMEMSAAQSRALATMNTALATGNLRDRASRTPAAVRAALDAAFGTNMATAEASARRAASIVLGRSSTRNLTLLDMMGTRSRYSWNPDHRSGRYAWRGVAYPSDAAGRRALLRRVLRAMNDRQPVIMSWLVDFNALDSEGDFELAELRRRGTPGRQGGHLVVAEDYVVDNVPTHGTLGLGLLSAEQRTAALDGTVRFFRIKNSWGSARPDRASHEGYYDLYMDYLNGPIAWRSSEAPDASTSQRTPLSSVILPANY